MGSSSATSMRKKISFDENSTSSPPSSLLEMTIRGGCFPEDGCDYDVFISFRGEDTRNNFTSHLYAALCRKQIKAFMDSKDLRTGHEISGSLLKAIQMSKLYLVIFSFNYGSSRWCLMELEKILHCSKQQGKKVVIPVFYKVDPSHVRNQTGSFGDAFTKHEASGEEHQVQCWRAALKEAANLSGLHLDDTNKVESEFIDEICEAVVKELNQSMRSSTTHPSKVFDNDRKRSSVLVGINSHIKKVMSLLCLDQHYSPRVRSVGIWGMGGIGKTTLAEAVFCRIHEQFDGYYFFENVREELKQLRKDAFWNKVLSQVLGGENTCTLSLRLPFVRERLGRKRVFIVFDDVEESIFLQLQDLAEHHDLFGAGSKILMTSRDKQVLTKLLLDEVYEVVGLEDEEALKLFSLKAFKRESPPLGYVELSNRVVDYARGNPLALTVLGSALLNRERAYWNSAIDKIQKFPKKSIIDLLRISYDGLSPSEKDMFLDIACFFKGEEVNHVEKLLDCYYDCVHATIINLIDKSLINISDEGRKVELHDLVQEMAWKMDDEEGGDTDDPGKRKRLHKSEDICRVLTEKKGTGTIEGVSLNLGESKTMSFGVDAFAGMANLRWLKVYGQNDEVCVLNTQRVNKFWWLQIFGTNNEVFLSHMRSLHWEAFPLKSLSSTFNIQNLVKLSLPGSKVKRLWAGAQDVVNLRWMDLSGSLNLTETPDLSKAKNLESLILENCQNLTRLHPSVQYLNKLQVLNLRICGRLSEIPSVLESKVLMDLSLYSCKKIKECPKIYGNMMKALRLTASEMKEVPDFSGFQFLEFLLLSNCPNVTKFAKMPSSSLEDLRACDTGIEEVPSSVQLLTRLMNLWLVDNPKLTSISDSISRLESLRRLYIHGCTALRFIPVVPKSLEYLGVENCPALERVAPINNQSHLDSLYIFNCSKLDNESLTNITTHLFLKLQQGRYFEARIQASEFPEWFPHQNVCLGSSITLLLPSKLDEILASNLDDENIYGLLPEFAFGFVLEFNPLLIEDEDLRIRIQIQAHPRTDGGHQDFVAVETEFILDLGPLVRRTDMPDQLLLCSTPRASQVISQMFSPQHCCISFQFSTSRPCATVKKCGAYLAYFFTEKHYR